MVGSGAAPSAVEATLRSTLLARVDAYRTRGLAGIAPYALANGKRRSPADELRTATQATKQLAKHAPAAFKLLLDYLHNIHVIAMEIPKWLSIGLVVTIFIAALIYARRQGPQPVSDAPDGARDLISGPH